LQVIEKQEPDKIEQEREIPLLRGTGPMSTAIKRLALEIPEKARLIAITLKMTR